KDGGGLDAVLSSDEPASASNPGSSFMFEMKLDAESTEDLPSIAWEFKAPDEKPQDSTTGILMAGGHQQLQPLDIRITFEKPGDQIVARLKGKFLAFDPQDSSAPVNRVDVQGTLDALIQEQN